MRHFDAWLLRDPYSIFHYYPTGRRWQETVRDLIQDRKICSPPIVDDDIDNRPPASAPIDPYARPMAAHPDSPLLSKLPAEIRLMIYRYAFGDEAVHLVQLKGKIRHVRCRHPASSLDRNRCCCPATRARWRSSPSSSSAPASASPPADMLYPHTHPSLPSSLSTSSLSLLRTCRAIYAEAADILYSSVVFDVDDLHTFIAFTSALSPTSLRSIRRLTVQWMPVWQPMDGQERNKMSIFEHTHNDRLWGLFWGRVAALQGLEELHLSLDLGRFSGNLVGNGNGLKQRLRLVVDEPWVAPLLCVRGLRAFELGVTARCDAGARRLLEDGLSRDAVALRDHLRAVLCSPRLAAMDPLCLWWSCGVEEVQVKKTKMRSRLAITAA